MIPLIIKYYKDRKLNEDIANIRMAFYLKHNQANARAHEVRHIILHEIKKPNDAVLNIRYENSLIKKHCEQVLKGNYKKLEHSIYNLLKETEEWHQTK